MSLVLLEFQRDFVEAGGLQFQQMPDDMIHIVGRGRERKVID